MTLRAALIWAGLVAALVGPLAVAATSPLLAWRGPVYIAAGFAGIAALALGLVQPLLAGRMMPGLSPHGARRLHRGVGMALIALVVVHVAALWVTSPPDMIDALTFTAPTLFSPLGVIAMWAFFAAGLWSALRRRLRPRWRVWRQTHLGLAMLAALASVLHALLIDGTMEPLSKTALCVLVVLAVIVLVLRPRPPAARQGAPRP